MAEAEKTKERIIEFPVEKLEHMNGFSMDFGNYLYQIYFNGRGGEGVGE